MGSKVSDEAVDRLEPRFTGDERLTELTGPDDTPAPLRVLGSMGSWYEAEVLLTAAAHGASGNTDALTFGWQRGTRVTISDPVDRSASVSVPAFRRLMLRIADVLVEGAEARHDPVIDDDEIWPAILKARELLRKDSPPNHS